MRIQGRMEFSEKTTVRRFNATLSAKGYVWFWPNIAAALTSKHYRLYCLRQLRHRGGFDLDLRVKPRDPEATIRIALREVQCPRCNGHGKPRIHCVGAASVDLKVHCGRCRISP